MTSTSASPAPSSPAPTPSAQRPVVRPSARPAGKTPQATSSKGPLIGIIVFALLAIAGVGAAGLLYTRQGPMSEEIQVHRAAALEAARAALITVDTNAAVDWATIWPQINAALATLRSESDRQGARLSQMERELEAAAGLQASLQAAQANAQRSAQQLSEVNAQLEAVRAESARKVSDLEGRLAAALKEAKEARAKLAASVASEAAPESSDATASEEELAASIEPPDEVIDNNEGAAVVRSNLPNMRTFPERRSDVLSAASYDDETSTMTIRLRDGTQIRYPKFPRHLYEELVTVPTFETFYRIKIMGRYPSIPDDKAAVRAQRRR